VTGINLTYNAEPTPSKLHASDAFYRGIMGPVRSGKSTAMCMEIMRRAREQCVGPDGYRRSRMAIIRNTYRELEDTTLKTWLMWFSPEYFGKFNYRSMTHHVEYEDIRCDVLFRALDRPGDIAKLLSMELTGGWVNESREVPKAVIDTLGDRVGQYPPPSRGGCTWRGVLMDTNPPDNDHWWYKLAEEDIPTGWEFFRQPGGVRKIDGHWMPNPHAENIGNLAEGVYYYLNRIPGKKESYVKVYYAGEYGYVQEGMPVHGEYTDEVHCAREELKPSPKRLVIVGLDFGLTPAAAFVQKQASGQWIVFDEITTEHLGVKNFGENLLGPKLRGEYGEFNVVVCGDPSGSDEASTDESTCFEILKGIGIPASPVLTNDPTIRRECVDGPLTRMIDGKPGILISPKCKVIRKGLSGGFYYRRIQVAGDERFQNKPYKNKYSHPVEALEYALMKGGEGRVAVRGNRSPESEKRGSPTPISTV
jgi:hypothetical protein